MLQGASFILCFAGLLLFLLALFNGFAIPALRSPRLGLSAHLTGLQSGTFLIAAGLMWDHIALFPAWNAPLAYGLTLTLAAIWLSLLLAAAFGAGQGLPIAGSGITTTPLRQRAVTALMGAGSVGLVLVLGALLVMMILPV